MQSVIKHQRIYQQAGGTSQTIGSGTTESIFEIKSDGFYFDKSYLEFTATAGAQAANHSSMLYTGFINQIDRIVVYTASKQICDVSAFNWLSEILMRAGTAERDFKTFSCGNSLGNGTIYPLVPTGNSGLLIGNRTAPYTAVLADGYNPYRALAAVASNLSGYEPLDNAINLLMSPSATANIYKIRIPLGLFYETLLASQRLQRFNESILVKFVWAGRDAWAFDMTNNVSLLPATATTAALGANIALTNLSLWVAQEKNQTLIDQAAAEINSPQGRDVIFTSYRQVVLQAGGTGNSTHSVSAKMSVVDGVALKRIYAAPFSSTESTITNFEHSNVAVATGIGGRRVSSYYSMFDMVRMQNDNVDCVAGTDLELIRPYLKGSLAQKGDVYGYHWFVLSDFTGKPDKPLWEALKDNADTSGRLLDGEHTYMLTMAVPSGIDDNNYRVFASFSKKMNVSASAGIQVV